MFSALMNLATINIMPYDNYFLEHRLIFNFRSLKPTKDLSGTLVCSKALCPFMM